MGATYLMLGGASSSQAQFHSETASTISRTATNSSRPQIRQKSISSSRPMPLRCRLRLENRTALGSYAALARHPTEALIVAVKGGTSEGQPCSSAGQSVGVMVLPHCWHLYRARASSMRCLGDVVTLRQHWLWHWRAVIFDFICPTVRR